MVTGDSSHCAHYIGRASGLIEEAADLLLADVDATGDVAWSFVGSRAQDNKLQVKMSTQQASRIFSMCKGVPFRVSQARLHLSTRRRCSEEALLRSVL